MGSSPMPDTKTAGDGCLPQEDGAHSLRVGSAELTAILSDHSLRVGSAEFTAVSSERPRGQWLLQLFQRWVYPKGGASEALDGPL